MATKFTFKVTVPKGKAGIGSKTYCSIKLNKCIVGEISDIAPRQSAKSIYKVRFKVIKADINEDKNPNCPWKWTTIKNEFTAIDDATEFVIKNNDQIIKLFPLYIDFIARTN